MTRAVLGTVILFARVPKLGRGKRRLAAGVGDLRALQVYRKILRNTLRTVSLELGWRTFVALEPAISTSRPGEPFLRSGMQTSVRFGQQGRDLGRKMAHALRNTPPGPCILIGADIIGLDHTVLRRALMACRRSEMVFGPAMDGGFWLIGCKRKPSPRCFDGIVWSQSNTLSNTVEKMPKAWRIAFVDQLRDIDEASDIQEFYQIERRLK